MLKRTLAFTSILASLILAMTVCGWAEDGIEGVWLTEERDSKIEFVPCGTVLCGTVVWLQKPNDADGNPHRDINNPDPSLREREILGLTIFEGLSKTDEAGEWQGSVYNPDDGDTYKTVLTLQSDGTLEVKGCVLGGLICGTEYWTRTDL